MILDPDKILAFADYTAKLEMGPYAGLPSDDACIRHVTRAICQAIDQALAGIAEAAGVTLATTEPAPPPAPAKEPG